MKTIAVDPSQRDLTQVLDQAREDDVILETPDGARFILSAVDEFDLEIARTRQSKELMAFLEERAKQPATISLEEVERELGLR